MTSHSAPTSGSIFDEDLSSVSDEWTESDSQDPFERDEKSDSESSQQRYPINDQGELVFIYDNEDQGEVHRAKLADIDHSEDPVEAIRAIFQGEPTIQWDYEESDLAPSSGASQDLLDPSNRFPKNPEFSKSDLDQPMEHLKQENSNQRDTQLETSLSKNKDLWLHSSGVTLILAAIYLSSPLLAALGGLILISTSLHYG